MESTIHIGLIGGSKLFREALAERLATETNMAVSCVLEDVDTAMNLCATQVVNAWFALAPELRENDLNRLISSLSPQARLVCFRGNISTNFAILQALLSGRLQWLESDAPYAVMLAALRSPASIVSACSPQLLAAAANEIQFRRRQMPSDSQCQANSLTSREREVAELAAGGLINKHIAKQLGIGITTVKSHLSSAMRKLEIRGRGDIQRGVGSGQPLRPGVSHPR